VVAPPSVAEAKFNAGAVVLSTSVSCSIITSCMPDREQGLHFAPLTRTKLEVFNL